MKKLQKDKEREGILRQISYWNEYYDKIAGEILSAGLGGAPEYWHYEDRLQKKALIRALKAINVNLYEKRLLDVGCGNGRLSIWFAEHGAYVHGIDISQTALNKAITISRKNNLKSVDFLLYGGSIFPFRDNSFDIVNMSAVLLAIERIGLTEIVISEMIRVCKPGGLILILELIKNHKADEYTKVVPEDRLIHLLEKSNASLVLSIGIYVDKVRFYFRYLSRFKVVWRILRYLTPLILKWSELIDEHLIFLFSKYAEKKLFVFRKT